MIQMKDKSLLFGNISYEAQPPRQGYINMVKQGQEIQASKLSFYLLQLALGAGETTLFQKHNCN